MHATTPDAIIVGVDTHKDTHVAVTVTGLGARLGAISTPATATEYRQLAQWAHAQGTVLAFGIEGTGLYGAGLSRALTAQGCRVIEVNRPNRQLRRQRGKATRSMPRPQPALFSPARPPRLQNLAIKRWR